MNQMSGYCRPTLCCVIHPYLVVSSGEPDVRLLSAHPLLRHTSSAGGESWLDVRLLSAHALPCHTSSAGGESWSDVRLLSAHPLPRHTSSAGGESW